MSIVWGVERERWIQLGDHTKRPLTILRWHTAYSWSTSGARSWPRRSSLPQYHSTVTPSRTWLLSDGADLGGPAAARSREHQPDGRHLRACSTGPPRVGPSNVSRIREVRRGRKLLLDDSQAAHKPTISVQRLRTFSIRLESLGRSSRLCAMNSELFELVEALLQPVLSPGPNHRSHPRCL